MILFFTQDLLRHIYYSYQASRPQSMHVHEILGPTTLLLRSKDGVDAVVSLAHLLPPRRKKDQQKVEDVLREKLLHQEVSLRWNNGGRAEVLWQGASLNYWMVIQGLVRVSRPTQFSYLGEKERYLAAHSFRQKRPHYTQYYDKPFAHRHLLLVDQ